MAEIKYQLQSGANGTIFEIPGIVQTMNLPYSAEMLRIIGILGGAKHVTAHLPDGTVYAGWTNKSYPG